MALGKITVENDYRLEPPKCKSCGGEMQAVNEISRVCNNEACDCYGMPKVTGVYPPKPAAHVNIKLDEEETDGE